VIEQRHHVGNLQRPAGGASDAVARQVIGNAARLEFCRASHSTDNEHESHSEKNFYKIILPALRPS
jgi:SRSO17 transposase